MKELNYVLFSKKIGLVVAIMFIIIAIPASNPTLFDNSKTTLLNDDFTASGNENLAIDAIWSRNDKRIDGSVNETEWETNVNHSISLETYQVILFIENDNDNLYFGIQVDGVNATDLTILGLIFDTGNDGEFSSDGEPYFIINSAMFVYIPMLGFFQTTMNFHEPPTGCFGRLTDTSDNNTKRISIELQLTMASLKISAGDSIPFVLVLQDTKGSTFMFPTDVFNLNGWVPVHTSQINESPPVLSGSQLISTGPPYYTNTTYTFMVNYSDADNNAPDSISVVIDGIYIGMEKSNASDENYVDGCTYILETSLFEGTHNYHFTASQGIFIVRLPNVTSYSTPFINRSNDFAPELSEGRINRINGDNYTTFTYSVKYRDLDNNPPASINVTIDGIPHAMDKVYDDQINFLEGVYYSYSTRLDPGNHTYSFNCTDGIHDVDLGPYSGPTVIKGNASALFDGLVIEVETSQSVTQSSFLTKLKIEYGLLENGSYLASVYVNSFTTFLSEEYVVDPYNGTITETRYYFNPWVSQMFQAGWQDSFWIPRNVSINDTVLLTFNGVTFNATVSGETWRSFNGLNRSCWIVTTIAGDVAYYDKKTGILLQADVVDFGRTGMPGWIRTIKTNIFNFYSPSVLWFNITPQSGDATTKFNFSITINDLDGELPESVKLVINGTEISFPIPGAWETEKLEIIQGINYTLSTFLQPGYYEYYILIDDGRYSTRYPTTTNMTLNVSDTNLDPPVLSGGSAAPFRGHDENVYIFWINYTDINNNPPTFVNVTVDGTAYTMEKFNASDMNMMDGCLYLAKMNLSSGSHLYHFNASDSVFSTGYPAVGNLTIDVNDNPVSSLFTGAEAEYSSTMYGEFRVRFSENAPSIWTVQETFESGEANIEFNNNTFEVISGTGIGGSSFSGVTHLLYFLPSNATIGAQFPIYHPLFGELLYQVTDVALLEAGGRTILCWVLKSDPIIDAILYYEEGSGLLVRLEHGENSPMKIFYIELLGTNIINQYEPSLTVKQETTGTINQSVPFIFNATYTDLDDFKPMYFNLTLNGTEIDCIEEGYLSNDNWKSGVEIYIEMFLEPGYYEYHFNWSDGAFTGSYPANNSANITVLYVNDHDPELSKAAVTPNITHNYTMPLYTVEYKDLDNNPPAFVNVTIDGVNNYSCNKIDPSDSNYVDGVIYYYIGNAMDFGVHNYTFYTNDGVRENSTGLFLGPEII
ncbi:MAG: hypothetical protein ACTSWN_03200, partial [Promethearchaeota archaeon]